MLGDDSRRLLEEGEKPLGVGISSGKQATVGFDDRNDELNCREASADSSPCFYRGQMM